MARAARVTQEGLTLKEEAVVQAFLRLRDETKAYCEVYSVDPNRSAQNIWHEASKLFAKPHIRERIASLVKQTEAGAVYDANTAMLESREAYDLAKELGQPSAMVAAVKLRAQLTGVLVERRDVTTHTVKDIPQDEIDRMLMEAAKAAGMSITASTPTKGNA